MLKDVGVASKETKVCPVGLFNDGAAAPNNKLRCRRVVGGMVQYANPLNAVGICPNGFSLIQHPAECR